MQRLMASLLSVAVMACSPAQAGQGAPTPAELVGSVIEANKSGDPERIVATFAPDEREAIQRMVTDPAMLRANTAAMGAITGWSVLSVRDHRGYAIVSVRETRGTESSTKRYPMKRTGEGWLLTNDLASDPAFQP